MGKQKIYLMNSKYFYEMTDEVYEYMSVKNCSEELAINELKEILCCGRHYKGNADGMELAKILLGK
jgi:hypothetical protein